MIWLTWRQLRVQAAAVAGFLVVFAAALAVTGPLLQEPLYSVGLVALYVAPAAIGVFWGVPLVARELQAGTHDLAWNQTVTRTRWLGGKLAVTGLAAAVATGLLSLSITWWAGTEYRMTPEVFSVHGIVPIGYAVFAFVLGVAAGILLRRVLVAMAVTLVVFAAVQYTVPLLVRPYLIPPVEETTRITSADVMAINSDNALSPADLIVATPSDAWLLSSGIVDAEGNPVSPSTPGPTGCGSAFNATDQCFADLLDAGYQQALTYQPASRFWALQWAETGLFLTMAALLTWLCFRRIRH